MTKPILCVDFDGVIHSYTSGWQGADVIPDVPVPGAIRFLREATKHFRVAIFSSRSAIPGGIGAMREWLAHYAVPGHEDEDLSWLTYIEWPFEKPPALVTIDDRAVTFDGTWPTIDSLLAFKPWNKKPTAVHEYPSLYGRGQDPDLDEAWNILDTVTPGVISTETRAWLAGLITGVLKKRKAQSNGSA